MLQRMWGNILLLKKLKNTTKKDFIDVTLAFDDVQLIIEKLQRMCGNILSLKKLRKHQRKRHVQEINLELLD